MRVGSHFQRDSNSRNLEHPVRADAVASLDATLALLSESLGKLKAALAVDIAEVAGQLKMDR